MLPELLYHSNDWSLDVSLILGLIIAGILGVAGWIYRLLGTV